MLQLLPSQAAEIVKELTGGLILLLESSTIAEMELEIDLTTMFSKSVADVPQIPFVFERAEGSHQVNLLVQQFALVAPGVVLVIHGLKLEVQQHCILNACCMTN